MELKWLEDFLCLADTRSFSRAAEQRHVTQPAFSRRIRALETWLGADLIDRSTFPTRLTPAGEAFRAQAADLLVRLHSARAQARGQQPTGAQRIGFAVPHALAFAFFPQWLAALRGSFGAFDTRLIAGNVHDAVHTLVEGGCDLLLVYHHPAHPVSLDAARFEGLRLASEWLRPYAQRTSAGQPRWCLPGSAAAPIPYLGYGPNAYLRRMADTILEQASEPAHLAQQYETDMAESLKAMLLAGHGLAFLPASAVHRELARGELAVAGDERWWLEMDVRAYRAHGGGKALVDRLWAHLSGARSAPERSDAQPA